MKEDTRLSYHQRIIKVLLHIQAHLDETLSLESLAAVAHFSPYHFHRVFRGIVGEPLAEHIRRLRLERAALRLMQTGRSVTDLAFEAGYDAVESFTRAFQIRFGLSPSAYRKQHGCAGHCPSGSCSGLMSLQINTRYGGTLDMEVTIRKIDHRKVAFVRHVGPYAQCETAWDRLCGWAGEKGLIGPETGFLGLSYDDPDVTDPEKLRYDACVTVSEEVKAESDIGVQTIKGGDFAVALHKGPYENLKNTYAALCGKWLPASGREVRDTPCVEVYLNDHKEAPPEELLVEIQVPLA